MVTGSQFRVSSRPQLSSYESPDPMAIKFDPAGDAHCGQQLIEENMH